MKLIKAREWVKKNFAAGSYPSPATVARWVKTGEVRGAVVGRMVYVDENYVFKNFNTQPNKQEKKELNLPDNHSLKRLEKRLASKGMTL